MLKDNIIFNGMMPEEIDLALKELSSVEKTYTKDSIILRAGDITDSLGLVISGSVTIESNDAWGNRTILSNVAKDGFFAETYALLENEPLLVDVRANENCRILFFKVGSLKKLKS
ncbi:MAG: cyclic nucleotide-binding domain-containing protein, partial [Butyrivibrio sp.]|nr:cyclic nucleotide-binding domain-containing protein [Butyrivibrio sp.]